MKPLLLLHGALGAKNQFDPLLPLLPTSVPVYTINFAGHGGAPYPEGPFRIETFATQLLNWLQEKNLEEVQVFGYSMGGYVALEAALQQPARFSRIYTLATKFNWTPEAAQAETAKLNPDIISQKVPAFAKTLQERHAPQDWAEVLRRTAEMMQHLGQNPTLTNTALAQIQTLVRVAVGDKDQMVSLEESMQVYRTLPQAQFQVLPNTKHPIEQLAWAQVVPGLLNFFDYA